MAQSVLFVDDEPDLEEVIRQKYRKEIGSGLLDLSFAANGKEALNRVDAANAPFDVVVTDINMPVMNGLELLEQLRKRETTSAILVLSAYGDLANIRTAMNRGAFDFLTKPISFQDLTVTLEKAFAHVRSMNERKAFQERARFVKETFGRFLDDRVVQTLLEHPTGADLGGERREISILMSDLRGFTALSERMEPEKLVALLNRYFAAMTEVVFEYEGIIDELLGDAMLVVFGAPLRRSDHADAAVKCAIAMQRAMALVNERSADLGAPQLEMGVAVNTGEAVVGNIGSNKRTKYGVVGSQVNLTARIEALSMGHQVLVSDSTKRRCSLVLDVVDEFSITPKGFASATRVHQVSGVRGQPELTIVEPTTPLTPATADVTIPVTIGALPMRHARLVAVSEQRCELELLKQGVVERCAPMRARLSDGRGTDVVLQGKVERCTPSGTVVVRLSSMGAGHSTWLAEVAAGRIKLTAEGEEESAAVRGSRLPVPLALGSEPPVNAAAGGSHQQLVQEHLESLGLTLAGAVHDIRTPIGAIVDLAAVSAELLAQSTANIGASNAAVSELTALFRTLAQNLGKIQQHSAMAADLIAMMADRVRGKHDRFQPVEVNVLLEMQLELYRASIAAAQPDSNVSIVLELGSGIGAARIAPLSLSRIVLNLVQNACGAAGAEDRDRPAGAVPRVVVSTREVGDQVEIRVMANAGSIPEGLVPGGFEPVFSGPSAAEPGAEFASARQIAREAGGDITFHSDMRGFAEFRVALPRA